jgi:hypothetical protein
LAGAVSAGAGVVAVVAVVDVVLSVEAAAGAAGATGASWLKATVVASIATRVRYRAYRIVFLLVRSVVVCNYNQKVPS